MAYDKEKKKPSVLVLDDDEFSHLLIKEFLFHNGIKARHVFTGLEAMEELKTHNYDIMLIDIIMPQIDGISVIKALIREVNMPKIYVCSGLRKDKIDKILELRDVKVDGIISKMHMKEDIEILFAPYQ